MQIGKMTICFNVDEMNQQKKKDDNAGEKKVYLQEKNIDYKGARLEFTCRNIRIVLDRNRYILFTSYN